MAPNRFPETVGQVSDNRHPSVMIRDDPYFPMFLTLGPRVGEEASLIILDTWPGPAKLEIMQL